MGGGRNSSSTEIDFGAVDGHSKGSNKDNEPKEFQYRDEDFQPLTAPQSNTKQQYVLFIFFFQSSNQEKARFFRSVQTDTASHCTSYSGSHASGHRHSGVSAASKDHSANKRYDLTIYSSLNPF